jgi:hypothetical protein
VPFHAWSDIDDPPLESLWAANGFTAQLHRADTMADAPLFT